MWGECEHACVPVCLRMCVCVRGCVSKCECMCVCVRERERETKRQTPAYPLTPYARLHWPSGFKEAYAQYAEGGWQGLSVATEHGGQGLPLSLGLIKAEIVGTANWAWGMYPGLAIGAMNTLILHASEEQKKTYLTKLTSGQWLGTMCLTEPHCGTDLGQVCSLVLCVCLVCLSNISFLPGGWFLLLTCWPIGQDQGSEAGRWHLPPHRHQDLHLLRRARHD